MPEIIKAPVGRVFKENFKSTARAVVNAGGARSGKSYALAQLMLMRAYNYSGLNVGITRKTMPALKMTAMRLFIDLLKKYKLYSAKNHNKMEHYYNLNGSRVQFFSLDDPEKIKSAEFNYIWLEEATEFNYADYITLLTRLSAPAPAGLKNQIFLTFNPSDANCWIAKNLLTSPDARVIYSSYKDNPFLSKDYIDTLESLKNADENYYRVFTLGQWGRRQNIIYDNYNFIDAPPQNAREIIWGLDFGFNNPTALVKVYLADSGVCAEEKLYKSGLTNKELIDRLSSIIPPASRHETIYADAAEPDRIKEIFDAGFNIKPANKAVTQGIISVKSRALSVVKSSANLIKEIQNYVWKTDLNGNALEDPVKFNDHALDALRYAVHTHFSAAAPEPEITFF